MLSSTISTAWPSVSAWPVRRCLRYPPPRPSFVMCRNAKQSGRAAGQAGCSSQDCRAVDPGNHGARGHRQIPAQGMGPRTLVQVPGRCEACCAGLGGPYRDSRRGMRGLRPGLNFGSAIQICIPTTRFCVGARLYSRGMPAAKRIRTRGRTGLVVGSGGFGRGDLAGTLGMAAGR